jgi:hypothetical protein
MAIAEHDVGHGLHELLDEEHSGDFYDASDRGGPGSSDSQI